jgi:branched-chain amino acid transport system permease protein
MEIFGIPLQAFLGQLMLGLVNGAFYAMLSLGLAVIFGLLDVVNFAHGALYMLGAFAAWIMLDQFGMNYWWALVLAPLTVGILGVIIERLFLKHLYGLDPLYGLLLTFGLALMLEGVFRASTASPARTTTCPICWPAPWTSASWSCRSTAPGWSWCRSPSAWAPGS